jgi:putative sigma-54 modulation protein
MNINLQARDFHLTESLDSQIRQKMRILLDRFDHKIRATRVVLSDINGPKGGKDKRCTIKIEVHNAKTIVVDEVADTMYESISRCSQRAKRAVSKLVSKDRGKKRERGDIPTAQYRGNELQKIHKTEPDFEHSYKQGTDYDESNMLSA